MRHHIKDFARETILTVANSRRVWLVHLTVNALLMVAFVYWTRISEHTGSHFALTVLSGFLIAFVTLWLHSATFNYFRGEGHDLKNSLRSSVSKVPAFFIWSLIFGVGLWLIGQLWTYDLQTGGYVRHSLPRGIRDAVTPRTAFSATSWLIWFLYFFGWPIFSLPIGAQVAVNNFRGFFSSAGLRPLCELRFWIMYAVCFSLGAYLPYKLVWMTPTKPSSLNEQAWSMVLRFGIAYVLMVTAWMALCAAITHASEGDAESVSEVEPHQSLPAGDIAG